ncbi:MAG: hypothetical protein FWE80_08505, partial [Oscillospiraceae bacterium]|nr:hypothetical protein [Oscillospiraceae bacterium]
MMCKQLFGYFLALALIFGLMAGLPAMDAAEDEPWIKVDFTAGNPDGYALTSSEVDTAGAYFAFDDYVEPHFTIPESDLAEGAETATGLKMYYHGNGFYFRPPADLFAEDDAVFIDIEWYWPGKKTQDQTRVNAEAGSGSYNKVFGDNGVSRDRLQGETGGDVDTACTFQWRGDLAATKLYLGNDNKGIHFMLWHSQNWSPEMDLPTYEEQYVVILSVTYRAVPVYGSRLDWSELLRLINDGGGNNELKTLYYDGAETYKEALAEAKALYASRFDGNRIIPLRFPADLTYVLTQHHIDAAVDKLKASNAFLTVKPDVYTLTNARFGEMSHVDPDLPLSGFVTTVGGYNCWAVRGDNKYFPLYEMGNILDGEKAVKFEISYLIEGWYGNNSRFYPGY